MVVQVFRELSRSRLSPYACSPLCFPPSLCLSLPVFACLFPVSLSPSFSFCLPPGINRKLQLKPLVDSETGQVNGLKLVMKWGGELTQSGLHQAQRAGTDFRELMYPKTTEMNGLLRLHSTYRHDLKLYSSDEGRVQMTAGACCRTCEHVVGREGKPLCSCAFPLLLPVYCFQPKLESDHPHALHLLPAS